MSRKSPSKKQCSTNGHRLSFVAVKKGAKRLTRWLVGLALLPCLWALLHQTGLLVPHLLSEGVQAYWMYLAGMISYLFMERIVAKPMWLYVVGHEMTHALTGLLSGAKIHSFKAKSTGGEVRLSKSNALIALSPYVVPLYLLVIVLIYVVTRHWWNPPQLLPVFQFMLGFALSFHISLTISAIHRHQPDLKILGHFLSGVLIAMGNIMVLAAIGLSLFSKTPTFSKFAQDVGKETWSGCVASGKTSWQGVQFAVQFAKKQSWIR